MTTGKYSTIFFDLDNTIWDFRRNSVASMHDLFDKYEIGKYCNCDFDTFYKVYSKYNDIVWKKFSLNLMTADEVKTVRFIDTFNDFKLPATWEQCRKLNDEYLALLPTKAIVFPDTMEVLTKLQKNFELHILSNGFIDVQLNKLRLSSLDKFFGQVITSEAAGARKPDAKIVDYALSMTGKTKDECIYIGDDFDTDVLCAFNAGIDCIWFNPMGFSPTDKSIHNYIEIKKLTELYAIFP